MPRGRPRKNPLPDDTGADTIDNVEIEPITDDNPVNEKALTEASEEADTPEMWEPKWTDYVLSHFEDDEIVDGYLLTDGVRRVVSKLLGPIVKSAPVQVNPPSYANNNHATVVWEVAIRFDDGSIRTFGDCADVSPDNTDPTFAVHASATAATKAEGRALRKALQLKRVLTTDEMLNNNETKPENINSGQINFINMMCERNNINVMKLINLNKRDQYEKIEDVPYAKAVLINKYLTECQSSKRKPPEEILGYDSNWRNS
jgi:hypothetical protein